MKIVNKVEVSGSLVKDPKYFNGARNDGASYHITTFDIVHPHPAGRGKAPDAYFFKCVSFNEMALTLKDLKVGDAILVKGFLKFSSYKNSAGKKMYITQIVVKDFDKLLDEPSQKETKEEVQETTDYQQAIKDSGLEGLDDLVF